MVTLADNAEMSLGLIHKETGTMVAAFEQTLYSSLEPLW